MLKKFVALYLVLHLAALLVLLGFISSRLDAYWMASTRTQLAQVGSAIRLALDHATTPEDTARRDSLLATTAKETGVRISLIHSGGKVLFDSEVAAAGMDDHSRRPEIVEAKSSETGFSSRASGTTGNATSYLAMRMDPRDETSDILRVAVAETPLVESRRALQRIIWSFGIALAVLAALVMWVYGFRQIQPMHQFADAARKIAAGEFESVPLVLNRDDEWQDLSQAFRHMQSEMASRQTRLVENSERLEAVLSSMVEGVVAIDPVGEVMLANDAACELLDLSPARVIGKKLLEQVRLPQLLQAVQQTQLQRTFATVEFETPHVQRRWVQARVACLAGSGRPGVTIVMHDMTELRKLESMRRDFVANVSHELKTPLASIKALAETLLMGAIRDQERATDFVSQIEEQADQLGKQIHDLLQLARVESGQASFEIVRVRLKNLLQNCIRATENEAAARGIRLVLLPVPSGVYARADSEALMAVVSNLLTNAIRYSHERGEVRIEVADRFDRVEIRVSDDGIGIAEEHVRRIFERFYRVDRARSREAGGTGLGLSIVKHVVLALGGSVRVDSTPGKGSTFVVELPGGVEEDGDREESVSAE